MRNYRKLIIGWMACLVFIGIVNIEAKANTPIDVDANASISVEYAYDDNPIADINFKIYYVATVSEDEVYTAVDRFLESGIDFNQLEEQEDWQVAIANLDSGIEAGELIADYEMKTEEDGTFYLGNLATGMYFIQIDSGIYEGQETVSESILYPVQVYDPESFTWSYDLKVVPKIELQEVEEDPEQPEEPEEPEEDIQEEVSDEEIPQTGSLEWLVPILAGLGMLLIALGFFCKKKGKEDEC